MTGKHKFVVVSDDRRWASEVFVCGTTPSLPGRRAIGHTIHTELVSFVDQHRIASIGSDETHCNDKRGYFLRVYSWLISLLSLHVTDST